MAIRQLFRFLLITYLFMLGCNNDIQQDDNLYQYEIIGKWKLESRAINNITDLSIACCDYLEFKVDDNPADNKGIFAASGVGYEQQGVFELNTTNATLEFDYDNSVKTYAYQVSDNIIHFMYSENDDEIMESWRKE